MADDVRETDEPRCPACDRVLVLAFVGKQSKFYVCSCCGGTQVIPPLIPPLPVPEVPLTKE